MKIASLHVVEAFVRHSGTSEAAVRLGITQSAVIKALRHVEEELGVRIASRVQGRLLPTPEARALATAARPSFKALNQVRHEAAMLKAGLVGRLRIASVPGLAHSILPRALGSLSDDATCPPVELVFDEVAERVLGGTSEFGLSYGLPANDLLRSEEIAETGLVCVFDRDDPLVERPVIDPGQLAGRGLISYGSPDSSDHDSFRAALADAGLVDAISIEVRHTDTACNLVREGCGVALVEGFVIRAGLTEGLVTRPLAPSRPVVAAAHWRHDLPLSAAARELLGRLRQGSR